MDDKKKEVHERKRRVLRFLSCSFLLPWGPLAVVAEISGLRGEARQKMR